MNLRRWLPPGIGVKRWLLVVFVGLHRRSPWPARSCSASSTARSRSPARSRPSIYAASRSSSCRTGSGRPILVGRSASSLFALRVVPRRPRPAAAVHGERRRAARGAHLPKRLLARGPRIVAIGGGTGLSTLLRGLKEHTSNLTAVVTVADDGGSSGRLREQLGIPAVGDIRNCIVGARRDGAADGRAAPVPLRRATTGSLCRPRGRQPADRRDDRGRGRRLRGGRPADEPGPRRPRPGRARRRRRRSRCTPASRDGREVDGQSRSCASAGSSGSGSSRRDVRAGRRRARGDRARRTWSSSAPAACTRASCRALLVPEIRAAIAATPGACASTSATSPPRRARPRATTSPTTSRRSSPTRGRGPRRRRARERPVAGGERPDGELGVPVQLRWPPGRRAPAAAPGPRRRGRPGDARTTTTRRCSRARCSGSSAREGRRTRPRRAVGPDRLTRVADADRDLVAALRAELAAIEPPRPCDRAAEVAGLGHDGRSGGDRPGARPAHGAPRCAGGAPGPADRRVRLGARGRPLPGRLAPRPLPRPRLASPRRGRAPPRVRRPRRGGAACSPARLAAVGPAGGVAPAARPGRRDVEERRGGRDVPALDRRPAPRSSSWSRARSPGRCAATSTALLNAESANLQRTPRRPARQLDAIDDARR